MKERKGTILVVGNDKEIRKVFERDLRKRFTTYNISFVSKIGDLEKRISEYQDLLRVVLVDNELPTISGVEIIEKYASHLRDRGIPTILISGLLSQDMYRRLIRTGTYGVLSKPVNSSALYSMVKSALSFHFCHYN